MSYVRLKTSYYIQTIRTKFEDLRITILYLLFQYLMYECVETLPVVLLTPEWWRAQTKVRNEHIYHTDRCSTRPRYVSRSYMSTCFRTKRKKFIKMFCVRFKSVHTKQKSNILSTLHLVLACKRLVFTVLFIL